MQDITAYTIITVVHHVVCCVGFGFVAFLMYHDRGNWGVAVCWNPAFCVAVPEFLHQQKGARHMSLVRI